MIRRIAAIVAADVRVRFRRPSTAVLFLLLSASAYKWVPAPSSGMALLVIDGRRALYNSAAIAMGTATLATFFIMLIGFYVISNAVARDVATRCGFVLASTGMRSGEYLLGKFAGNVAFLVTFIGGFMLTSMGMLLVRGEAPLEPLVFIWQYVLLAGPAIVFVSALALVFEAIRWLSGRLGDVLYFFGWIGLLGVVASLTDKAKGPTWLALFDVSGFGFLLRTMRQALHTDSVAIGASDFDPRKGLFIFHGLQPSFAELIPRIGTCLLAAPLLVIASLFFHRFDPARVRITDKTKRNWLGRINAVAKPFAQMMFAMTPSGGRASFLRSIVLDSMLTISAMPIASFAILVFNALAIVSPMKTVTGGLLPLAFAAMAITIADIACRESRAGTTALVRAAPQLRERFVIWKLAASLVIGVAFFAGAIVRFALSHPAALVPLIIAIVFVCAAATMLGVVSANPKSFIVAFLLFWYVAMNDKGANAALDYAGLNGVTTPLVMAGYAAAAILFTGSAAAFHAFTLRRS